MHFLNVAVVIQNIFAGSEKPMHHFKILIYSEPKIPVSEKETLEI